MNPPAISLRILEEEFGSFLDAIANNNKTLLAIRLYLENTKDNLYGHELPNPGNWSKRSTIPLNNEHYYHPSIKLNRYASRFKDIGDSKVLYSLETGPSYVDILPPMQSHRIKTHRTDLRNQICKIWSITTILWWLEIASWYSSKVNVVFDK